MRRRLVATVGLLAAAVLFGAMATACGNHSSGTTAGAAVGATGATGSTGVEVPAAAGPTGASAGNVQLLSDVPPLGPNIIKTGHLRSRSRGAGSTRRST